MALTILRHGSRASRAALRAERGHARDPQLISKASRALLLSLDWTLPRRTTTLPVEREDSMALSLVFFVTFVIFVTFAA